MIFKKLGTFLFDTWSSRLILKSTGILRLLFDFWTEKRNSFTKTSNESILVLDGL